MAYDHVQTLEMFIRRTRTVLAHAIDESDDWCQCGYYEDATGDPDPAMNICWKCAATQLLDDMRELKLSEIEVRSAHESD
jgi:hypothetical protein